MGEKNTPCSIQTIKHDGKNNPPMLFGSSGSPVIFKECGKYVFHGIHGYGEGNEYMLEYLKLLQTQKKWIQSEIYKWAGRNDMIDTCFKTGRRSFMPVVNLMFLKTNVQIKWKPENPFLVIHKQKVFRNSRQCLTLNVDIVLIDYFLNVI